MVEVNEVLYPTKLDTVQNFPDVTEVTEATGEDINRNRDAILAIERTLGTNPHIGLYTLNPLVATVAERFAILENGIAAGRFAYRNLNVNDVLVVTTDQSGLSRVDIGGIVGGTRIAPVNVRGPFRVYDSGLANNGAEFQVPVSFTERGNDIQADSAVGEPILSITDTNANLNVTDRYALDVVGNVRITGGRLTAEFAVDHSELLGIDTVPTGSTNAIHVTRGDYHSHKRLVDPVTGALLNEVDSNPSADTYGLVDHNDLLNIFTKNGQSDFVPVVGVAYHVTNGDDHDHRNGRGAPLDHNNLSNIDPSLSNHVTGGDEHAHSPTGDGAIISHNFLNDIGFLTHWEIDQFLNVDFAEHLALIDPPSKEDLDPAKGGMAYHVPAGHVSDPSAHHTRYSDEEALNAQVLVSADTTVYEEGRNTAVRTHIQAIGSGSVSAKNAHGLAAADIGALEGFDAQGNLPDFTRQYLEQAIREIIQDPSFGIPLADENTEITGIWTFHNTGGVIQLQKGALVTSVTYDDIVRFPDIFDHIDNTGTPPYHDAADISNTPAGTIVATDVQAAIDELDGDVQLKEDQLGPGNLVTNAELDNTAASEAVDTNVMRDGAVTLIKMSNPYFIMPFTFTYHFAAADVSTHIFAAELPALTAGATVIQVTAQYRYPAGPPLNVLIDAGTYAGAPAPLPIISWFTGGAGAVSPAPVDIMLLPGTPNGKVGDITGSLPSLPATVAATEGIYAYIARNGAVDVDVTVTVYVKLELTA